MRRFLIIVAIVIGLAAVSGLVILGVKRLKTQPSTEQTNNNNAGTVTTTPPAAPPAKSPEEIARLSASTNLKIFVKTFAERFGSYSTDNHFENLESLKPMMTEVMIAYTNKIIADGNKSKDYFGVTTRVISQATEQETATQVVVRVKTQRQETKADGTTRVFYQDLVLTLVKVGNSWLVDQAKWQ